MSLVNDALRKARLEAARQEAHRSGAILPTLGQVRRERRPDSIRSRTLALVMIVAMALLVFLLLRFSAPPTAELVAARGDETPQTAAHSERIALGSSAIEPPVAPTVEPSPSSENVAPPPDPAPAARQGFPTAAGRPAGTPPRQTPSPAREAPSSTPPPEPQAASAETERSAAAGEVEPQEDAVARRSPAGPVARQEPEPAASPRPETETAGLRADTVTGELEASDVERETADGTATAGEIESFVREASFAAGASFRLDGIAWSSDRPFALVNGQVIGPGTSIDGAKLIEVAPDRVILEQSGRRFELTLR